MNRWLHNFLIAVCTLPGLSLMAQKPNPPQKPSELMGIYFGGFGGWIVPCNLTLTQMGTAFFSEGSGGPLAVMATGSSPGNTKVFGGLHIGYEWMKEIRPGFRLAPALELEGSYFANTAGNADVDNPTTRLDAHEFIDTLPMRIGTLLANGILEFNNDYVSPYLGAGVGVGFVSIHDANALQIDPAEPFNHFNSDPNAFNTVFATQVKGGLRYRFLKHYRLSAEYRFLYLSPSNFLFGSTNYPTHVPTSPWTIKSEGMRYNTFTIGLDFLF